MSLSWKEIEHGEVERGRTVTMFSTGSGEEEDGAGVLVLLCRVLGVEEVEEAEAMLPVCSTELEAVHGVAATAALSCCTLEFQKEKEGAERRGEDGGAREERVEI